MTAVTPRLSRLIRAGSLRALQDTLIGMMGGGDALWAADTFILVPTRAAAEQLRRTVEDRVLPERGALAWPAVGTRSDWYQALRDRAPSMGGTLTSVEREAILTRVAREVSRDGVEPPFALRPALTAEMLALYDFIRRQGRTISDFERNLAGELEPSADSDRGAAQLLAQTRFLAETFRRYEGELEERALLDEHRIRRRLLELEPAQPLRRVVVTVGDRISDPDGLWPVDFLLLSTLPGLEEVSVLMTEQVRSAGLLERLHAAMPGIEEVQAADIPGMRIAPAGTPTLVIPGTRTGHAVAEPAPAFVARDREEELRHVARRLKAGRHGAVPLHRKALVVRRSLPYVYLARGIFERAGISFEMTDTLPLAAEPYAAAVDLVLECVISDGSRSTLVALLASPHFSWGAFGAELTPDEVLALDYALADARFLGGRETLRALAERWDSADPVPPGDHSRRHSRAASAACRVAARVSEALAPLAEERAIGDQTGLLHDFLVTHRRPDVHEAADDRLIRVQHAVHESLRRIGQAARAYDPEATASAGSLSSMLRRWLEGRTFDLRSGRGGVRLLDAQSARYADLDEMHLLGLVEGEWPEPVRPSIFYAPSLLALLEPTPVAIAPLQREHQLRTSALAAFRDLLALPRHEISASTFQLEADSLVSPSPYLAVLGEFGTQTRIDATPDHLRITADEALTDMPPDTTSVSAMASAWARLRGAQPGRDDAAYYGQVGTTALDTVSVTRIDRYLKCPFQYFAHDVLRLKEAPEDEETQSPLRRGSFLHRVLEECYREWERQGRTTIDSASRADARRVFVSVTEQLLQELPHAEAQLERHSLLGTAMTPGMIDRVLDDDVRSGVAVKRRWTEFELQGEFSFQQEDGHVRQVRLHGKVDRVDLFHDGTFRIVDYKTGGTPAVKDTVQLQVYAAAVAQALRQEGYSGLTPASASFVSLTKAPASSASLPGRGHSMEDRVRDGEARLLAAIDDIAAGRFPPKPAQASTCDRCSFASVCRKDIVGEDAHDEPGQGGDDE